MQTRGKMKTEMERVNRKSKLQLIWIPLSKRCVTLSWQGFLFTLAKKFFCHYFVFVIKISIFNRLLRLWLWKKRKLLKSWIWLYFKNVLLFKFMLKTKIKAISTNLRLINSCFNNEFRIKSSFKKTTSLRQMTFN